MNINIAHDGVDHINVYSQARTNLGRQLSNFAFVPFSMDGRIFSSVEAYWYWLSTGERHDHLCPLYGARAKAVGKELEKVAIDPEQFELRIKKAIRTKIESFMMLRYELKHSILPLKHYYVYGKGSTNPKVVDAGYGWIIEYIEALRDEFQKDPRNRLVIAGSRNFLDHKSLTRFLKDSGYWPTEIVSGKAKGPDSMGEDIAKALGLPVQPFPADWDREPRRAGYIRNTDMAVYADKALIVIVNESRGSLHMLGEMKRLNKPYYAVHIKARVGPKEPIYWLDEVLIDLRVERHL